MRTVVVARVLVALASASSSAVAQRAGSLDVGFGSSYGAGGEYRSRSGIALGAQLDHGSSPNEPSTFGITVRFDLFGSLVGNDRCDIGPSGNCLEHYPFFMSGGIGPVWTWQPEFVRVHLAGGAGDYIEGDDFSQNLGFFGQLRIIGPRDAPMGLGLGLTLHFVPNAVPDPLLISTLAVTIRFGF